MKRNIGELIDKFKKGPSLTYTIIFINVIVYLLTAFVSSYYFKGGIIQADNRALIILGAMVNLLVGKGQYYRLFTSGFLHGSLLHLALNMVALGAIGEIIEKIMGKGKYLIIYISSLLLSSLGSYLYSTTYDGVYISVGASGAIFGLFGSLLVICLLNRKILGKTVLRGITELIVVNILIGIFVPNIDMVAHVVGAIVGALVTYIILFINKKKLRKQ